MSLSVLRVGCGGGGRSRPSTLCSGRLVRGRRRRSRGGGFARGWLSLWRGEELGLEGVVGEGRILTDVVICGCAAGVEILCVGLWTEIPGASWV